MWSILFTPAQGREDELVAELWELGTDGIAEESGGMRAFFRAEAAVRVAAEAVGNGRAAGTPRQEDLSTPPVTAGEGEPLTVGERFFVVPSGSTHPTPQSRLRLEIESSTAFGTGRHETTQLCLQAAERLVTEQSTVLDIGCGSGILSAAAVLLGAQDVISCDIDENALSIARKHLGTPLFRGSVDAVEDGFADVVFANISAAALEMLAFDLKRVAKPDGTIVLSGFIKDREPKGYNPRERLELGDWLLWTCKPSDITATANSLPVEGLFHKPDWWV